MSFKTHLLGLSLVAILSGVASYSNVAKQFQLASVSGCYTQSQIDTLNAERTTLQSSIASTNANIASVNAGITANNNAYNIATAEITRLTSLLYSSSTLQSKYNEATSYLNSRNATNRKKYPKLWASYNTKYSAAISSYNSMVSSNTTNNNLINAEGAKRTSYNSNNTTLRTQLTTLTNSLTSLNTQLTTKDSEILSANSNKCSTTTTTGTTTTTTTSSYVPDTGSHSICSTNDECTNGEVCISSMCVTPGSDRCETSADCHSGDTCMAGNCATPEGPGDENTDGVIKCCACYYDSSLTGSYNDCKASYESIGCDEKHDVSLPKSEQIANLDDKTKVLCKYDPVTDNKKIFSIYSQHGNQSQCDATFSNAVDLAKSGISGGIFHNGCKVCADSLQSRENAQLVQDSIVSDDQVIYVFGNQNSAEYDTAFPDDGFCGGGGVLYKITKQSIEEIYNDCPAVGSYCEMAAGSSRSCARDGKVVQMSCVADSANSKSGKWR